MEKDIYLGIFSFIIQGIIYGFILGMLLGIVAKATKFLFVKGKSQ